ncbi:MAG: hypothetical protein LBK23_11550 [Oscillospiraceae bacterium]|jgi:hypothetical protein|nr:hypothetical protein [Oscillospiraceae bacterium]
MLELIGLLTRHVCERLSNPHGAAYYAGGVKAAETLALLCGLNRYVYADVPRSVRRAVDGLRARTGASVILEPSPERVLGADIAILEAGVPRRRFSENCVVYATRESYYDGVRWSRRVGGIKAAVYDGALRESFTLPAAYNAIRRRAAELGGIIILTKPPGQNIIAPTEPE